MDNYREGYSRKINNTKKSAVSTQLTVRYETLDTGKFSRFETNRTFGFFISCTAPGTGPNTGHLDPEPLQDPRESLHTPEPESEPAEQATSKPLSPILYSQQKKPNPSFNRHLFHMPSSPLPLLLPLSLSATSSALYLSRTLHALTNKFRRRREFN